MNIIKNFLVNNNCYKQAKIIKPKGIMVHSTAVPGARAINFVKSWNVAKPNGQSVCVHAFLDDKECYQTLPWNYKAWHAGGSANNELIGFEICEPRNYADKVYFETVKHAAIELCVFLCKAYHLTADSITTHCEGYERKGKVYASNHSDIHHWWKRYFNYSIEDFRNDVARELNENIEEEEEMRYQKIEEIPDYAKATIQKLVDKKILNGNDNGLDLSEDMIRMFVINDRAGLYNI